MSEIEIIGVDMSPFVRTVRIACVEKGAPNSLSMDHIDSTAEMKSEAHLAFHPFGKMPAIRHDEFVLLDQICAGDFKIPIPTPTTLVEPFSMGGKEYTLFTKLGQKLKPTLMQLKTQIVNGRTLK